MNKEVKRIPIKYTGSSTKINLINGGNINMEEDFVFEGSQAQTINQPNSISIEKAIEELIKNINIEEYTNQEV